MKVLIVIICFGLIVGCGEESQQRIIAENRELDGRFREALLAQDVGRVMSCWWQSPEAVQYPGDNLDGLKGRVAIRDATERMFEGMERTISVEFRDQHYMVHGDAVIGTGVMVMKLQPAGLPKDVELMFRYTDIRERKDGGWVYTYRHESTMPFLGL